MIKNQIINFASENVGLHVDFKKNSTQFTQQAHLFWIL